jgi:hypothetical protein
MVITGFNGAIGVEFYRNNALAILLDQIPLVGVKEPRFVIA